MKAKRGVKRFPWVMALLGMLALGGGGCLKTREDLKEIETSKVMKEQVSSLQKVHADSSLRLEELQEQNRSLIGRIDDLEYRLKKSEQVGDTGREDLEKNLEESRRTNLLLQESIVKLENRLQVLQEEIVSVKAKEVTRGSKSGEAGAGTSKPKDKEKTLFELADTSFQDKNWKEAILNFDQYREKHPKGKFAAEATYKTGVCFQELGMKDEAKVFYQEVLAKFPQSEMAKKAQTRMKTLK